MQTILLTKKGKSFSYTVETSEFGNHLYCVVDGQLPPGLSLDKQTGKISGRSTSTGNFSFVIKAEKCCKCEKFSYIIKVRNRKTERVCPTLRRRNFSLAASFTPPEGGSYDISLFIDGDFVTLLQTSSVTLEIKGLGSGINPFSIILSGPSTVIRFVGSFTTGVDPDTIYPVTVTILINGCPPYLYNSSIKFLNVG